VLRHLPPPTDPSVLVGPATCDDAAVYRLAPDLAAVATVDYITPVVDDPYQFGLIAAANAISDVYAMGATPRFALNLVNFPRDRLPLELLIQILQGGAFKAAEAGVAIVGGHSIDDPEPKYGLAVFGTVHPERIVRNAGARPGDRLVLTKPLGIGIITTAIKRGAASPQATKAALATMATLNRAAAEAMVAVGVNAATDVTGFGLLGHLCELLTASGVAAIVAAERVPVLRFTWEYVAQGLVPGGTQRNLASLAEAVVWPGGFAEEGRLVLADAQTSGGLLIAVPPERADRLLDELRRRGVDAACDIGEVVAGAPGRIEVR
jgi:selenide,water dikinase